MINSVRNTVLSILNKNNYGYISPSDFNLFANQAQLELFDDYFSSYNDVLNKENARMSGAEYGDAMKFVTETIDSFSVSKFLSYDAINRYFSPSPTTTGSYAYLLNKVLCYHELVSSGTNTSAVLNSLVDNTKNFNLTVSIGDIVVNETTGLTAEVTSVGTTTLTLSANIFPSAATQYKIYLGEPSEAKNVQHSNITMLLQSNLTAPTLKYPSYTIEENKINIYPKTIQGKGRLLAQYIRYPYVPKWTYITLLNGSPVFDQSQLDYQDFELPTEDEYKLVSKILQYCGISIREMEVAQFAMAQEQQNK